MNRSQAETQAALLVQAAPQAAFARGMAILNAGYPELLLAPAERLADRYPADPRMAQMLGLAARAAAEGPLAYRAFRRAAKLAPGDPLLAHSLARTALEAGHSASALFEAAQRLAPADGSVLQGLAAALVAEGRAEEAVELFAGLLRSNPLWLDGHRTFAHLAGQFGRDPCSALDGALSDHPANTDLHRLKINTLLEARQPARASDAAALARRVIGPQPWLALLAAHARSEQGEVAEAARLFAAAPPPGHASEASLLARHLIKARRYGEAVALLDGWRGQPADEMLWPYRALAWRLTGDPREDWLEGDPTLVGVYDLAEQIGDIPGLAAHLRALHTARAAPLDQSVRGGTQTDGNLLLREEAPLQALRSLLLRTAEAHVARLAPPQPGHPTLIERRAPLRIAGSWSVRLSAAGFHADHVHPQGWFSSALYIALPDTLGASEGDERHAGWLSLGESRDLVPDLPPRALIEPRPGRFVLFPSAIWHGTRSFAAGERLTVALDIAKPKQD